MLQVEVETAAVAAATADVAAVSYLDTLEVQTAAAVVVSEVVAASPNVMVEGSLGVEVGAVDE